MNLEMLVQDYCSTSSLSHILRADKVLARTTNISFQNLFWTKHYY